MATSRLLSLIEVLEGGPRADEVDLGKKYMKNGSFINTIYTNKSLKIFLKKNLINATYRILRA